MKLIRVNVKRVSPRRLIHGLRTVNDVIGLTLALAKLAADYRRHATHDRHDKRCECLPYCTPCITETLRREKQDMS